jgi:signal transduction histidine kinase
MRDESLLQIERNIARCRLIFSVVAPLAIYLDPTEPTLLVQLTGGIFILDPYALLVLLLYFAYSLTVYVLVARDSVDVGRVAVFSTWADVLFGAAVALVTEGTNSPYHIFFAFAVLAAGLRGTFRTAIAVTAVSITLYLSLVLIFRPEGLGYYVTRASYLAITGYLVGVLGRQRMTLQSDLLGVARSLHDGYAQALAGVTLRVASARELLRRGRNEEALAELTELQVGVTREYDELRAYVRSLARLEVTPASLPTRDGTRFAVRVQFEGSLAVVEHALQIMVEGARNVGRHAQASAAAISAHATEAAVVIRIDDDGVGFSDVAAAPWSISSRAAELGGTVHVDDGERPGAHVVIELPRG